LTEQRDVKDYQNFADRGDLNGGLDAGLRLPAGVELLAGYRGGRQEQASFPFGTSYSFANTYQRVLAVVSTRPCRAVELSGEIGPSFHEFEARRLPPGRPDHEELLYFRGNGTLTLTTNSVVKFSGSQSLLPSASGRAAYQNIAFGAGWEHRWGRRLTSAVRFELAEYDFLATSARRDRVYTPSLRLNYEFNRHCSANVFASHAWADSLVPGTSHREYRRNVYGVGLKWTR
jgi:hypothetical protein